MRLRRRKRSTLNFGRTRKKFNIAKFKHKMTWILQVLGVIAAAYLCVACFGIRTTVVGQAMSDTLENGDKVFLDKVLYRISGLKANDVIVFLPNGNEKSHYYIRRIIGVPGDTVQIKDGAVYINGELYNEIIEVAAMEETGIAGDEILLGEGEYFVLGDNRNNSEDSRYANIGNIKKEYIVGRAWFYSSTENGSGFVH